jgi:cephalosporin hydroxylase
MLKKVFKSNEERVDFNLSSIYEGHYNVTYRGITTPRSPFDYLLYQMIIHEIKPDLIIEIGTLNGGSSYYMSDLLELIGKGIIHTIDISKNHNPILDHNNRIEFFYNGWQGYDIKRAEGYKKILVIDDGSHKYDDTYKALLKFSPLVSVNSYYIVEDGIVNALGISKNFKGGPLKAIKEFLKNNHNFSIDRKWCDFFGKNATFNVNGFIKRTS